MIRHIVMLGLNDGYDTAELAAVMEGLAGLELSGFVSFEHGVNRDFEQKTADFPYGFVCSFTDEAALRAYAQDAEHQALGARLVALCGGADRIMVMDLSV